LTNFAGPLLINYLNNHEKFQLLDNNNTNNVDKLTIRQFTKGYTEKPIPPIDNERSNTLLDFAKTSPFLSILAENRSIDKKEEIS
jgi:hypothetical protein